MTDSITQPSDGMRFRFHDARKVHARLLELGFPASLLEAEGVRTFHSPGAVLVALNGADLEPHLLQFLAQVLQIVKRDHACRLASGLPLPELPRPRFSRRRRTERPESSTTQPSASRYRVVNHFGPPSPYVPTIRETKVRKH
jgi:hypothetical protein